MDLNARSRPPLERWGGRDFTALVRTAYGEARGREDICLIAIVWTVINRKLHAVWLDKSIAEICREYPCWEAGTDLRREVEELMPGDPESIRATAAVVNILNGDQADPTHGATHYHDRDDAPQWAIGMTPRAVIVPWVFYRSPDRRAE